MTIRIMLAALAASTALLVTPAQAEGQGETLARAFFGADSTQARQTALAAMQQAAPTDNSARFALGSAQFFAAVEGLSQDLSRHGFTPPGGRRQWSMLPLSWPDKVEPLDYDGLRALLARFETGLEQAAATLATVSQDEPVGIVIGFNDARFDMRGDGAIPADGSFLNILAGFGGALPANPDGQPPRLEFRFDNADAIWLQGYANVLMAQTDFLLAHDFRRGFDLSLHSLFPRAGLPLQEELAPEDDEIRGFWDGRAADALSFIHLLDWPVADGAARARARGDPPVTRQLGGDPRRDRQRPRMAARAAAAGRSPDRRARCERGNRGRLDGDAGLG